MHKLQLFRQKERLVMTGKYHGSDKNSVAGRIRKSLAKLSFSEFLEDLALIEKTDYVRYLPAEKLILTSRNFYYTS